MIELIIIAIIIWIGGLTVELHIINKCLDNQMRLLYLMRDEINTLKFNKRDD